MLVREVMRTEPVTVRADALVEEALDLLDGSSESVMPVVSAGGVIVGAVSQTDLIREVARPDVRDDLVPAQAGHPVLPPRTVVEVMDHRTVTVREDSELAEVADLVTGSAHPSVPVIDEHHHVVGLLDPREVTRLLGEGADAGAPPAR